jgi:hypothetical protein
MGHITLEKHFKTPKGANLAKAAIKKELGGSAKTKWNGSGWDVKFHGDTYSLKVDDNSIRIKLHTRDGDDYRARITEPAPGHGKELRSDIKTAISDAFEAIDDASTQS